MKALEYLQQRGISKKTITSARNIKLTDNAVIAYYQHTDGKRNIKQYLNLDGSKAFEKGSQCSDNYFFACGAKTKDAEKIVVVKSVIDALSVADVMPEEAALATGGSTFYKKLNALPYKEKIVLAFDNDEAGRNATRNTIKLLGEAYVIPWRADDPKDFNELLKEDKRERIRELIDGAYLVGKDTFEKNTELTHSEKSVNVSSTCHSDKRLINNNKNNLYDTCDTCDTLFEKDIIVDTEDFPINVYPEQIRELINDYTNGFNLSKPDIPAITLLMIVATGIGATRQIQISSQWKTYANLFIGLIASSGSKKTPILTNLLKPLTDRNIELIKEYQEQKKLYEKNKDKEQKEQTEKPILRQIIVNETTYEKLAQILRDNPRGILIFNDELRSYFNNFGAYSHSKGKADVEKSFYDRCYDCTPITNTTITHDVILNPRPLLNIYGGIQPKILKKISKDDMESGSLQRWMFFLYIKKPQYYKHYEISNKSKKLIECLYQYCMEFDFVNNEPVVVKLSKDAEKQFSEYYNKFEDWRVQNHIPEFDGFLAKCPVRIAKIAFILEVIDSFLNNKSPDSLLFVTKKSVDKAYLIVDWFARQNEMLWSYSLYNDYILNPKSIDIELCRIILNLTKTLGYRIPIKDIQENLKRKGFNKSDKAIHKILRDFGFQKYRDSKTRGVEVGQDVLEKIKSFLNKVSQASQVSQTANSPTITTSYLSDTLVTHSEKSVNVSQMKNEQTEKLTKVSFSLDGIL